MQRVRGEKPRRRAPCPSTTLFGSLVLVSPSVLGFRPFQTGIWISQFINSSPDAVSFPCKQHGHVSLVIRPSSCLVVLATDRDGGTLPALRLCYAGNVRVLRQISVCTAPDWLHSIKLQH